MSKLRRGEAGDVLASKILKKLKKWGCVRGYNGVGNDPSAKPMVPKERKEKGCPTMGQLL